jgi:hypothetical protein
MTSNDEPVLTPGQWDALLYGTDGDLRRFVARLAIRHGHLKPEPSKDCPVCGTTRTSELVQFRQSAPKPLVAIEENRCILFCVSQNGNSS